MGEQTILNSTVGSVTHISGQFLFLACFALCSGYWWVLAGTGRYRWVLVGTGGYWWVLAMLWDVFEAHVVGRAWWIDNACGTGALIGALIRPADLVNLEGLRTLS